MYGLCRAELRREGTSLQDPEWPRGGNYGQHHTHIASKDIYVHEVEVVEGPSTGGKFLHNLDFAEPVSRSPRLFLGRH